MMLEDVDNSEYQHTINDEFIVEGIGLHTGKLVKLVAKPASENKGIIFRRIDLPNKPVIEAKIENVIEVLRGTTIGKNGVLVHTVEHLLSAFYGSGVDNVEIELDGEEPPALDGSAWPFIELILKVGIRKQDAKRIFCKLNDYVFIGNKDKFLLYLPSNKFEICYTLKYPDNVIPEQKLCVEVNSKNFVEKICKARTFGFTFEFSMLFEKKLALGGSIKNAVIVDSNGTILNPEGLRDKNEFVFHKILDLIGDLALIGKRIKGYIIAYRTGHAYNWEFAKELCKRYKTMIERTESEKMIQFEEIKNILPHRYPMLLVDRIIALDPGKSAIGIKNVTGNEEFFEGHFPQKPVMPGVLIIEAMAQVAGVLFLSQPEHKGKIPMFVGIDGARFRKPVVPGDRLEIHVNVLKVKGNIGKVSVIAKVDGEEVSSAELMFSLL